MFDRFRRIALTGLTLLLMSSAMIPPAGAEPGANAPLAKLCEDYWQGVLLASPVTATSVGDKRYDDRLGDNSPAGKAKDQRRLEAVLKRAQAIDEAMLSPADRVTRGALIEQVSGDLATMACGFDEWVVDPLGGPQVELISLADYTEIDTPADAAKFVKRCRAMGPYLDQHIANLRRGLAAGKTACDAPVKKVIAELNDMIGKSPSDWGLMAPAHARRTGWPSSGRSKFAAGIASAIRETIEPAFERYRDFLKNEVLPKARSSDHPGLVNLPGGTDCYRAMIRKETSLDRSPEEIHKIGLEQVANFRKNLSELGAKALGTGDIAEIQKRLRTDPAMHFRTAEEVEAKAREALARAQAAVPQWFGLQPKTPCEVKVMGMHEAPNSTVAYYRPLALDGSRPGYYMINTYLPETRPRYEAEALAFHESVPGHHLQIAIAAELKNLPTFRRNQGVTAYVEGWALYTERLADEMGLYSSDTDRIGMWSYDAWRGCRLVVDTGIHSMGWTRQQAIDYMVANSVLAENNIENEVDRYITWPGQALAYKTGQLEILALRDEAKQRLGARFDIKAFHDAVLRNGAVALPVLRREVEAWIASVEARP